jgi:hypothetical protein
VFEDLLFDVTQRLIDWREARGDQVEPEKARFVEVINALRDHVVKMSEAKAGLLHSVTYGAQVNLPDFLEWIAARLVDVHGENRNIDYVHTLYDRAESVRAAIAKATTP